MAPHRPRPDPTEPPAPWPRGLPRLAGLVWLADERRMTPWRIAGLVLMVVVAFALGLPSTPAGFVWWTGGLVLAVATLLGIALPPWGRLPAWLRVVPPLVFAVAVALLREGAGPVASALASLLLLPIVWASLVLSVWGVGVVVATSTTVLLLPVLSAAGGLPAVEWRRALLFLLVTPVIALVVQGLVAADRRYAARLARMRSASDAVIRSVGDGLLVLDEHLRIVAVNDAACRIVDRPSADLVSRPVTHLLRGIRPMPTSIASGPPQPGDGPGVSVTEYLVDHEDGRVQPLEVTSAPLITEEGDGGRVIAFRDITQRLRHRRLVAANLAAASAMADAPTHAEAVPRLAAGLGEALDAAVVTFWELRPSGPGGSTTLALQELWVAPGSPRDRFVAATRAVTGDRGLPAHVLRSGHAEWVDDAERGDPERFPRVVPAHADGLRTMICLPLGGEEPVGLLEVAFAHVVSADDLTRDVLDGLALRIGDAARRERLEAEATRHKDEFFALVSHELRTPLTSISGYLELLVEELSDDPVARRFLDVVDRNTARLRRLVEDLLFVARVDAGQLTLQERSCDLAALVGAGIEAARPAADAAGLALWACVDPPVEVLGDEGRLGQVLDNLLSNALKFTPAGRRVEVHLSARTDAELGPRAVLEVVDTGMGIGPADLDRLFGRFVRSAQAEAENIPGVGLGLVITRAIVAAHGGTVAVSSTLGEGTTFRVELPLRVTGGLGPPATPTAAPPDATPVPAGSAARGGVPAGP